jgi:uncharacterized protein YcfJ
MKLSSVLVIAAFSLTSTTTLAAHNQHGHSGHNHKSKKSHQQEKSYANHAGEHYGRVVSVEPVYRTVTRPVRVDSCLQREPHALQHVSYTGTLLGAVIGGAIGHRIGDAHGDPGAAALAGGLLGASIGRDINRSVNYNRGLTVTGPCRVSRRQETVRELVEYRVRYRYNGQVHRARMDHHPGEWIKLDVDVSPA